MLSAYAFPAANGARVGSQEISYLGVPFLRSAASVTAIDDGVVDDYTAFTRPRGPRRDLRRRISCGWSAKVLYFLGMTSSCGTGSGGWYTQTLDAGRDFFIGDRIGEITVRYREAPPDVIPLVVGFTAWWQGAWQPGQEPFCADGPARRALLDSLFLHDVFDTSLGMYVLAFLPRSGAVIDDIVVCNNPAKEGWPTLHGLTVGGASSNRGLVEFCRAPVPEPPCLKALDAEILADEDAIRRRVRRLQEQIYTFLDDLPTAPVDAVQAHEGPSIRYTGSACAEMLTREYASCLGGSILRGDDRSTGANGWYSGIGTWSSTGPAGGAAWTRDWARLLVERTRAGALRWVEKSLETCDSLLYGVGRHRPAPRPHWVQNYILDGSLDWVLDGQCHFPRSTRSGEVVVGNLENDGHGLLMLARYRYWIQAGRDPAWLARAWTATSDAAEWVCWQLDNPFDVASMASGTSSDWLHCFGEPERAHFPDCLWTESESTYYGGCESWSSSACYAGLLASVRMAEARGETAAAERWSAYALRLRAGMLASLVEEVPGFGTTWRVMAACNWRDYNHALGPLIHMADLLGLDLSDMDPRLLEVSRATYAYRIRRGPAMEKHYSYVRAFGYGQAFMTESALLLDEMEDATRLIETAARSMHSPHHLPWMCAEGVAVHESGRYWYRVGGMGNEVQIASMVRVMRMIAGIDDADAPAVRLVPRLPLGWEEVIAEGVPIAGGGRLGMRCRREESGRRLVISLEAEEALPVLHVRAGPFHRSAGTLQARVNGSPASCERCELGDSSWVWVRGLREVRDARVEVAEA
jgi:hypothetical protein